MRSIGVSLDVTEEQFQLLKSRLGLSFNIHEVLNLWANKQLNKYENLTDILNQFSDSELQDLEYKELTVNTPASLQEKGGKASSYDLDKTTYKILSEITQLDPEHEVLSQPEIEEILMGLEPGLYTTGPTGAFTCNKVFEGSGDNLELKGVRIMIRTKVLGEIQSKVEKLGASSLKELLQTRLQIAFSGG